MLRLEDGLLEAGRYRRPHRTHFLDFPPLHRSNTTRQSVYAEHVTSHAPGINILIIESFLIIEKHLAYKYVDLGGVHMGTFIINVSNKNLTVCELCFSLVARASGY